MPEYLHSLCEAYGKFRLKSLHPAPSGRREAVRRLFPGRGSITVETSDDGDVNEVIFWNWWANETIDYIMH